MDNWDERRSKIIELGKAESSTRPKIKRILERLEENDQEGMLAFTVLLVH